ncbi:MAG: FMN-binding protein [Bacteroidales bacterium]|nr:FMN-binding protein [Bacteroidales bacterium]
MKKLNLAILSFAMALLPLMGLAQAVSPDVKKMYPKATSIQSLDNGWVAVKGGKKLLGYIAYSKPASDGIKGFNGETPLMICFDAKQKITKVSMLPNGETPSFAKRVEASGLLDSWNGLSVEKALSVAPDAVSGATYTSRSVMSSMSAALKKLAAQKPSFSKKSSSAPWIILVAVAAVGVFAATRKKKDAAAS